jgi:hypothetical protein
LLEAFWVLRSVYDFKDIAIAHATEAALGLASVQLKTPNASRLPWQPLQTALISRMRSMLLQHPAMLGPSQPSIIWREEWEIARRYHPSKFDRRVTNQRELWGAAPTW